MIDADPKDFTIDSHKRIATHKCGAIVTFPKHTDLNIEGDCSVRNGDLFHGSSQSLVEAARIAMINSENHPSNS